MASDFTANAGHYITIRRPTTGPQSAAVIYRGRRIEAVFGGTDPWPSVLTAIKATGLRLPDKDGARRDAVYSRYYFAKSRAASRSMAFTITIDDVFAVGDCQDWKCAISRMRFVYESGEAWSNPYGLSLDRIDSAGGYTPDNVRLVLVAVNAAMGRWGEEPLKRIARRIYMTEKTRQKK